MGEDWREFRARLVARERSSGATPCTGNDGENNVNISDPKKKQPRKKQSWQQSSTAKEETTGGIFSAILSSMFSKGGGRSSSSNGSESSSSSSKNSNKERARTLAEQVDAATTTRARQTKETTTNVPSTRGGGDIFDGYSVGGATKFSTIGVSSSSTASSSPCSDPFMDEEECALIYNEPNIVKLDKHRWAHPLFHVEPGCILVANERLGGVFHQTIVLIIDHNEAAGSTGMVINR